MFYFNLIKWVLSWIKVCYLFLLIKWCDKLTFGKVNLGRYDYIRLFLVSCFQVIYFCLCFVLMLFVNIHIIVGNVFLVNFAIGLVLSFNYFLLCHYHALLFNCYLLIYFVYMNPQKIAKKKKESSLRARFVVLFRILVRIILMFFF